MASGTRDVDAEWCSVKWLFKNLSKRLDGGNNAEYYSFIDISYFIYSACCSSVPEKRWDCMIDILKTKFLLLLRKPAGFIIITIIICTFAYILGLGQQSKMPIAVYSDLDQEQTEAFLLELKEIPEIDFTLYDEEEAIEMVKDGNTDVAVHLMEKKFELIISPSYLDAALLKIN